MPVATEPDDPDAVLFEARRLLRARRARRSRTMFFVKLGALCAGLLAITIIARAGLTRRGRVAPDPPHSAAPAPVQKAGRHVALDVPTDWTHRDLQNHLFNKGVKFAVESAGTTDGVIWAFFRRVGKEGRVTVGLCRTPTHALEVSGGQGDRAFAAGRFVVYPTPASDYDKERANFDAMLEVAEALVTR